MATTTSITGLRSMRSKSGYWNLSDEQAAQLREFLLRGGFLMVDDFHGTDRVE